RNNVRLDDAPHLVPIGRELGEEKPCVLDIHIVAPGGQLHGEELVGCQRSYQERGLIEEDLAESETVDISLRRVVEPIVGKIEIAADALDGPTGERRIDAVEDDDIDVLRRFTRAVQEHHGRTTDDDDLAPGGHALELA